MTTMTQHPARKEIKPGMLLRIQVVKVLGRMGHTEQWVTPHDVRGGSLATRVPMFALPKSDAGAEPYGAYNANEQVQCVAAVDEDVEVLLASGEQVFVGSPLVSAGDGTLCHWQSCPGAAQIIAYAAENVDLDGLPARIVKCRTRL